LTSLSSAQRKQLRGLAHGLKPVVMIGKAGLAAAQLTQIDGALADHELIKVRFLAGKPEPEQVAEVERKLGCGAAGVIGHIAILYRQHPEPEKRRIRLERP